MAEVLEQKPIEITLGDGSKIVGKDLDEALKNAAKRLEDTAKALKDTKAEKDQLAQKVTGYEQTEEERRAEQERQAAVDRQKQQRANGKDPGFDKAEYYRLLNDDPDAANAMWFKHRFGANPEELLRSVEQTNRAVNEINQERVATSFWRQHPEFPQEVLAAKALDKRVGQLMNEGHPFNVRTFNIAYQELVDEDAIKPLELDAEKNKEKEKHEKDQQTANPALSGPGIGSTDDAELQRFEKMDDKALEAIAREKGWLR
jgi:hypothetical protein